jgi:AmiR/NasT family two-component response regulator
VATIAILQRPSSRDVQQVNEQLAYALNTRILIEQAKGVLAERAGLDMEGAFSALRRYARAHQQLLSEVARAVVDGELLADAFDSA